MAIPHFVTLREHRPTTKLILRINLVVGQFVTAQKFISSPPFPTGRYANG
ncbi:MAG TPA: hypothetical protein V6D25_20990 [Leptolyngbyaceae cyanobacterium]